MTYLFLRFKNNLRIYIGFFALALMLSAFVFYANENYINSDRSKVTVVDLDKSTLSAELIENFAKTDTIRVFKRDDLATAKTDLELKKVDFIAVILPDFEKNIGKDLYEDSIDIYFREADTKTDIIKDSISIEVVKLWVDEEFKELESDSDEVELREYIDLIVRDENGELASNDTETNSLFTLVFLFLIAITWVFISKKFFIEKSLGIRARLERFEIKGVYHLDNLLFKILLIELLSLSVCLGNYLVVGELMTFGVLFFAKLKVYLYAVFLEFLAQSLSILIKKTSSFVLLFEMLALISFVLVIILT